MTREPNFEDLVGRDLGADEEKRLRGAHELLLAAGPLPELPQGLEEPSIEPAADPSPDRLGQDAFQLLPRRRLGAMLALAAAIALIAFVSGYVAGFSHDGFAAQYSVPMHATAKAAAASAKVEVGKRDSRGNYPLRVEVSGLPKLKQGGYYEMFLTRGKRKWTCGTFAAGGQGAVKVRLTVPYDLESGDGWIITKERQGQPAVGPTVLTT
jgi:Anti-sigma-K factor rskA